MELGLRPVSEGVEVASDSGGESLVSEGGRRQHQLTEHRAAEGGVKSDLCTYGGERVGAHQQAEQQRVSSGVASEGLVDGLRGGVEAVEDPQALSLRLVGEQQW